MLNDDVDFLPGNLEILDEKSCRLSTSIVLAWPIIGGRCPNKIIGGNAVEVMPAGFVWKCEV